MPMGTRPKGTPERNWMDGQTIGLEEERGRMEVSRAEFRKEGRMVMVFQLGRASLPDGSEEQVSSRSKGGFRV